MAKLKVTKQFKILNNTFLPGLVRTLPLLIIQAIILAPNSLFANEHADDNFQFTGVILINGALLYSQEDDFGYKPEKQKNIYHSDDESVRLITSGYLKPSTSWEIQYLNQRQTTNLPVTSASSNIGLFRIRNGRHYFIEDYEGERHTVWYHELDRLFIKYEYENYSVITGRQAISWGSGRFWQPTDVFGAFSPTELNREYKPGIDAIKFDYFPNHASDLALAYVFGNRDEDDFEDSAALNYRTTIGQDSEIILLAGKIAGVVTGGGSFETSWLGIGWRAESILFEQVNNNKHDNFSIVGLDYQFPDNLLIGLEYYYNSLGATKENKLPQSARQLSYLNGQQKHLGQNVIGLSFSKILTPLLTGNYNFLASFLETPDGEISWSTLHQLFFSYSLMNEADALLAVHYGTGKGLDNLAQPRSEFGHTPASLSLQIRYYF